jgi:hypothetical protein
MLFTSIFLNYIKDIYTCQEEISLNILSKLYYILYNKRTLIRFHTVPLQQPAVYSQQKRMPPHRE